jgi:hypothetical protein
MHLQLLPYQCFISGTTLSNSSGCNSPYVNYPPSGNTTATLATNGSYTISFTSAYNYNYQNVSVWLDANHDGVFQASEQLVSNLSLPYYTSSSTTLTIPSSALLGQTKMRVRSDHSSYPVNDPCNPLYYGETEDYTVTIACGHNITASAGANGSISPAGTSIVNCGDSLVYTITPDANYIVDDVLVDGTSVGAVTSYTFTNIQANHTISVTFKHPPCSGAPAPGNTISTVTTICPSTSFTLSLQNDFSLVSGITYQWQSSPDGITFTDISGATSSTYATSQSAAIWYHCVVTCTASGQSTTSSDLKVDLTSYLSCYCTPGNNYNYACSYYITHVAVSGTPLDNYSSCPNYYPPYTNYPATWQHHRFHDFGEQL